MKKMLYSRRTWLLLIFPAGCVTAGVAARLLITRFIPDAPHAGVAGLGTAIAAALLFYSTAWKHDRKTREKP